jgi:hypothetical protein
MLTAMFFSIIIIVDSFNELAVIIILPSIGLRLLVMKIIITVLFTTEAQN